MTVGTIKVPTIAEIDSRLLEFIELAKSDADDVTLIAHACQMFTGLSARVYQERAGTMYVRCRVVELADGANPLDTKNIESLPSTRSQCAHPPASLARLNRANFDGDSKFYCSNKVSSAVYEMRPTPGQFLVVGYWQSRTDTIVQNIGKSRNILTDLGCIDQTILSAADHHAVSDLDEANTHFYTELSKLFTDLTPIPDAFKYRVTAAIATGLVSGTLYRDEGSTQPHCPFTEFSGLSYPGIQVDGNAVNYAFSSHIVDQHFDLLRADLLRVDRAGDNRELSLSFHGFARCHNPGALRWKLTPEHELWVSNRIGGPTAFVLLDGQLVAIDLDEITVSSSKIRYLSGSPVPVTD